MRNKLFLLLLSMAFLPGAAFATRPDGALQASHPGRAVHVDANGNMIGIAQASVSAESARVYFEVNEKRYYALLEDEGFHGFYLYYDGLNCTGNAYVRKPHHRSSLVSLEALRDGKFYAAGSDVPQQVDIVSVWEEFDGKTNCDHLTTLPPIEVYPAVPIVDTNVYIKPYKLKLMLAK
ncbi:MAG: hypothetical protein PVF08_08585 [Gammaproteobacteria bacterium]